MQAPLRCNVRTLDQQTAKLLLHGFLKLEL